MAKPSFVANRKRPTQRLNITSLMDVLTIVLIFLLGNYSEVVEEVSLPDYISLPTVYTNPEGESVNGLKLVIGNNQWGLEDFQIITFDSFNSQKSQIEEKFRLQLKSWIELS